MIIFLERKTGFEPATLTLAKKGYDIGRFASFGSAEQGLSRRLFR